MSADMRRQRNTSRQVEKSVRGSAGFRPEAKWCSIAPSPEIQPGLCAPVMISAKEDAVKECHDTFLVFPAWRMLCASRIAFQTLALKLLETMIPEAAPAARAAMVADASFAECGVPQRPSLTGRSALLDLEYLGPPDLNDPVDCHDE